MKDKEAYKYCPRCGGKLTSKDADGKDHLRCKECQFIFYLNAKPCVVALIVENNSILFSKRDIEPRKGFWELPGGFMNKGENAEEALRREMKEELDIELKDISFFTSLTEKYEISGIDYDTILFYFICGYDGKVTPQEEVADYRFLNVKEFPKEMAFSSEPKALSLLKKRGIIR